MHTLTESVLHIQKIRSEYDSGSFTSRMGVLSFLDGEGNCTIDGHSYCISDKNHIILSQNSCIRIQAKRHSIPVILFFNQRLLRNAHDHFKYIERLHERDNTMNEHLQELYILGSSSASFQALKASALIRSIYQRIMDRAVAASTSALCLQVTKKSTRVDLFKRLDYVKDLIHIHYSDSDLDIKDLSKTAGMNYHHFLRMFTHAFSVIPRQYLINVRLQKAKELLATTTEPISVICNRIGYQSMGSFSWLFKNEFSQSPSSYRNQF